MVYQFVDYKAPITSPSLAAAQRVIEKEKKLARAGPTRAKAEEVKKEIEPIVVGMAKQEDIAGLSMKEMLAKIGEAAAFTPEQIERAKTLPADIGGLQVYKGVDVPGAVPYTITPYRPEVPTVIPMEARAVPERVAKDIIFEREEPFMPTMAPLPTREFAPLEVERKKIEPEEEKPELFGPRRELVEPSKPKEPEEMMAVTPTKIPGAPDIATTFFAGVVPGLATEELKEVPTKPKTPEEIIAAPIVDLTKIKIDLKAPPTIPAEEIPMPMIHRSISTDDANFMLREVKKRQEEERPGVPIFDIGKLKTKEDMTGSLESLSSIEDKYEHRTGEDIEAPHFLAKAEFNRRKTDFAAEDVDTLGDIRDQKIEVSEKLLATEGLGGKEILYGTAAGMTYSQILSKAESKEDADMLLSTLKEKNRFELKLVGKSPTEALNVLEDEAGKYRGQLLKDQERQAEYIDNIYSISDPELKRIETGLSDIRISQEQDQAKIQDYHMHHEVKGIPNFITATDAFKDEKIKKQYTEKAKGFMVVEEGVEAEVPDFLMAYAYNMDQLEKHPKVAEYEQMKQKALTEGTWSGVEGAPISFTTQEEANKFNALATDVNTVYSTYGDKSSQDFENFYFSGDEISQIESLQTEGQTILKETDEAVEAVKSMDAAYLTEEELQREIDEYKYTKAGKAAWLKGVKDIGGLAPKAIQATIGVGQEAISDTKAIDYRDVLYEDKQKKLLRGAGVETHGDKLKDFGIAAGLVAVASTGATGIVGGITTVGRVYAGVRAGGMIADKAEYLTASDEVKTELNKFPTRKEALQSLHQIASQAEAEGWGGEFKTVRKFLTEIPFGKLIPGVAAKKEFKNAAIEYYKGAGLTGDNLDVAVEATMKQRRAGVVGETLAILMGGIAAERSGRGNLRLAFKKVAKGIYSPKKGLSRSERLGRAIYRGGIGFKEIGAAASGEGLAVALAKQESEYRDIDWTEAGKYSAMGYVSGGIFGAGLTASAGTRFGRGLEKAGNWADWYEKPSDIATDYIEKFTPGVKSFMTRKTTPVFTFTSVDVTGKTRTQELKGSDITGVRVEKDNVVFRTKQGPEIVVANTKENVNEVGRLVKTNVQEDLIAEIRKGEKVSRDAGIDTRVFSKELPDIPGVTEQKAEQPALEKLDILQEAFTETRAETKQQAQAKSQAKSQAKALAKAQIQAKAQTTAKSQAQAKAKAAAFTPRGLLPGMIGYMPRDYGYWKRGAKGMRTWVTVNPMADYATEFKNKLVGLEGKQHIKESSKQTQRFGVAGKLPTITKRPSLSPSRFGATTDQFIGPETIPIKGKLPKGMRKMAAMEKTSQKQRGHKGISNKQLNNMLKGKKTNNKKLRGLL